MTAPNDAESNDREPASRPENGPASAAAAVAPAPRASVRPLGVQVKIALVILLAGALAALFWPRGPGRAPGGFLVDANGRPQPLAERMEPVTLVHFWATWCPPCITEIPALDRLREDLADRPDFTVLMVAVRDDTAKVEEFLGTRRGGALFDPEWDVAHRYGTYQLPESYLVVRGQVVEKWEGEVQWDSPEVRRRITQALDGTS